MKKIGFYDEYIFRVNYDDKKDEEKEFYEIFYCCYIEVYGH